MTTPTINSHSSQVTRRAPTRPRSRVPFSSAAGTFARRRSGVSATFEANAPKPGVRRRSRCRFDPLGRYTNAIGRTREVIAGQRDDGSVLVMDRDALTLGDRRLVAHLGADEPTENAALVCAHYLEDAHRGRCRRVTAEDLTGRSLVHHEEPKPADASLQGTELVDRRGDYAYRLELVRVAASTMELRWCRRSRGEVPAAPMPVCLREVIGAIESYEPVCGLTLRALATYREDVEVSIAVLRGELERLRESPIVLNRKLRQAVLAAIEQNGLSMSEIAVRCGRVKRDSKGNASGETSWLARRVGILPESGARCSTPWVHSDVLALIARDGLGISPREVELG